LIYERSRLWVPEGQIFICLWQDEHGRYVMNEDGEFLCAESRRPHDPEVEGRMRQAARYYGIEGGHPVWRRGRKVTREEHEVQMERLLQGLIPDEREAVQAATEVEEERRRDG
jgi:hypothetical protein